MKTKSFYAFLLMLVVSISIISCEKGGRQDSLDGTLWETSSQGVKMEFYKGTVSVWTGAIKSLYIKKSEGKYSVNGNTVIFSGFSAPAEQYNSSGTQHIRSLVYYYKTASFTNNTLTVSYTTSINPSTFEDILYKVGGE